MSGTVVIRQSNTLVHHGIKGQRWGVRRYQNEDGSLTAAGKKKLEIQTAKDEYKTAKKKYITSTKSLAGESIKHPIKTANGQSKYGDAFSNMVVAKAKYKASKYDDPAKKEKAEKRVYQKALAMAGQKWSEKNVSNYGVGGNLQDRLKKEKGEAYVKSCQKKINATLLSTLAASSVVAAGAAAFTIYKSTKM